MVDKTKTRRGDCKNDYTKDVHEFGAHFIDIFAKHWTEEEANEFINTENEAILKGGGPFFPSNVRVERGLERST